MGCGKYGLVVCILYGCKFFCGVGCLIGVIGSVNLRVGDLEVLNTCGLILCGNSYDYIALVEAEGNGFQNLIHDGGAVLDSNIAGDGLIYHKFGNIGDSFVLCEVGVLQLHRVDGVNVKLHTCGIQSPYIASLRPVSGVLCVICVCLGGNVHCCAGDILCSNSQFHFRRLEVMLGNLNGCSSLGLVIVLVPGIVIIIGNIEYRSYIVDMDFLGVGSHCVGGTVGVGQLDHIVVIAGQCDLGFPLVCSCNLCPGNILSHIVHGQNRCRSNGFISCCLQAQIKVCLSNGELDLSFALGVEDALVLSYLITRECVLILQTGCDGICYNYILIILISIVLSVINDLYGYGSTCISSNCMGCSKDILIFRILNSLNRIGSIAYFVGIIGSILLNVGDNKVIYTRGNVFGSNCNLHISLIEAKGNSFKNLVNDRGAVLNLNVGCIRLINDKLICSVIGSFVLSKVCVSNINCVDSINIKCGKRNGVNISIGCPVVGILCVCSITLSRNIHICAGNILCNHGQDHILSVEVAFGNCKGSNAGSVEDIIPNRNHSAIRASNHRSSAINNDLLRILGHFISGLIAVSKRQIIGVVTGEQLLSLPNLFILIICPGESDSHRTDLKDRVVYPKIKVCFIDFKSNCHIIVGINGVARILRTSKFILNLQLGRNGINN